MAYDVSGAKTDFLDIQLDEFGEEVTYYADGASGKTILAVIYRDQKDQLSLPSSQMNPSRTKVKMKISRDATGGIETIVRGTDKVQLLVEPDDEFQRTLRVHSVDNEYGAWMLGLM